MGGKHPSRFFFDSVLFGEIFRDDLQNRFFERGLISLGNHHIFIMLPLRTESLKLDSSNPFRNLPQSFLIDANREANVAFTGFAETVARRCHDAGFFQ